MNDIRKQLDRAAKESNLAYCSLNVPFKCGNDLSDSKMTNCYFQEDAVGVPDDCDVALVLKDSQFNALDLQLHHIRLNNAAAVAEILKDEDVISLSLAYNHINLDGALVIANALPNSHISRLNLAGNKIGGTGALAIVKILRKTQIVVLDLSCNGIEVGVMKPMMDAFKHTAITTLCLSGNEIRDSGAKIIAEELPETQIAHLHLVQTGISTQGAIAIAGALNHTKLSHVCLGKNDIRNEGAIAIANALPGTRITSLELHSAKIDDKGFVIIANALERSRVSVLRMDGNGITDCGVFGMAKVLKNTNITDLDLDDNKIEYAGTMALMEVIPDTYVTRLLLATTSSEIKDNILSLIIEQKAKVNSIYDELQFLVRVQNNKLEFVLKNESSKPSEYIKLTKIISDKQQAFLTLFSNFSYFPRDLMEDFIHNVEIRLAEFLSQLDMTCIEHVQLLLSCEEKGLSVTVENLLVHRPLYSLIRSERENHLLHDILHPAVYILMNKYGKPWCFKQMRPTKEDLLEALQNSDWDDLIQENHLKQFHGDYSKATLIRTLLSGSATNSSYPG